MRTFSPMFLARNKVGGSYSACLLMVFVTSRSDNLDTFFEARSQLCYKFSTIMLEKSQYVQSNTLSPNNRVASHSAALNPQWGSEVPLPPHEIEVIPRVLVTADTDLSSHRWRPREKDAHLFWGRV